MDFDVEEGEAGNTRMKSLKYGERGSCQPFFR
jgi:hypothetical protein